VYSVDTIPVDSRTVLCVIQLSFIIHAIFSIIGGRRLQLFLLVSKAISVISIIESKDLLAASARHGVIRLIVITTGVRHGEGLRPEKKCEYGRKILVEKKI
jgi:hypothetical protein